MQRESLISAVIMGEGPDMLHVLHRYSSEFGDIGGLCALEEFPDFPQVKAQFLPNIMELVSSRGLHYGLPITGLPFVLAVNKKILADHDLEIPSTWEELRAMGPVLKASGIHAFTMPGGPKGEASYRFFALLGKAGGRVLSEDWTRATFAGPAGLGALRLLVEMQQQGHFPEAAAAYLDGENLAHWCTERAAISVEGPWWQYSTKGQYDFDVSKLALAPVPVPAVPLEPNPPRTLVDVSMVSITGYSEVKEEAWEVAKTIFLEHPSRRSQSATMSGLSPVRAAYGEGLESDYIDLEVLLSQAQVGLGWPNHPKIAEIQVIMAIAINTALAGVASPEEALLAAAAEVDEILSEY